MPWEIIYTESFEDKASALKRERQIKGWSRAKKEALIAGEGGELRKLARRRVF
jgi:predicted GIY-YIG superfamily endonuclease